MKLNFIKNILSKPVLLLLCIALACSGPKDHQEENSTVTQTSEPSTKPQTAATYYYINSNSNESLAEIIMDGKAHTVKTSAVNLFGKLKADKRKYYDQNDQLAYVIKYKEGLDFKLRNEQEELLWKVKVTEDKIKIANNEEWENAFEIKQPESGRIKLKQNDEDLQSIRFDPAGATIAVGDKYQTRGFNGSLAMGVLIIEELSEIEKIVICTEILGSTQ